MITYLLSLVLSFTSTQESNIYDSTQPQTDISDIQAKNGRWHLSGGATMSSTGGVSAGK